VVQIDPDKVVRQSRVTGAVRVGSCLVLGLFAGAVGWWLTHTWPYGLLIIVIGGALTFVVSTLATLWPMNADETAAQAGSEDVNHATSDLAVILIAISSFTVIGILLFHGSDQTKAVDAGLAIVAVLSVWAMLHTLYSTRDARVYYQRSESGDITGGIDFNTDDSPCYQDFFYFGFNLGMTYQVSDTAVSRTELRSTILRHCILSYIFGTMVLACTINLVLELV